MLVGNVCLKNLIARPRPCWLDSSVRLLIADPTDYSFPSGHTLSSVIGATILTKTDRRFGYAAIPLAALIAFSRLYLYAHFPSDVLAAAVLGVMIGELAFYADRRWTERRGHKAFPAISFFEINPQKDTQAGGSHNEGASGLRVQFRCSSAAATDTCRLASTSSIETGCSKSSAVETGKRPPSRLRSR